MILNVRGTLGGLVLRLKMQGLCLYGLETFDNYEVNHNLMSRNHLFLLN